MTKSISLSAAAAKARDAVAPAAPASKPNDDDGQVDSFAALLDTATPAKADEPDGDGRSERSTTPAEREESHEHARDLAYFAPADLALAWLASKEATPRSQKESGKTEDARGTATSSGTGADKTASRLTNSPESGALAVGDEAAEQLEDGEEALHTSLQPRTPPQLSTEVGGRGAGAAASSSAASSERRALAESTGDSSDLPARPQPRSGRDDADVTSPSRTTSAATTPSGSPADLPARQGSSLRGHDGAPQSASGQAGSDPSRDRDPLGTRTVSRAPTSPAATSLTATSPASTTPVPAMSSTELPSRPGEMAGAQNTATEANGPGQSAGGAFVGADTGLSAAITKAQRGSDGSYRMTALLNPPSLGRIDATIKVSGESVEIAITPHTPEGHEALSRHLDELQRDLASEHGEVHLSLTGGGDQARHGNDPRNELIAVHQREEDETDVETHSAPQDSSLHIIL